MSKIDYNELPYEVLEVLHIAVGGICPECHYNVPGMHLNPADGGCELAEALTHAAWFMCMYVDAKGEPRGPRIYS